ARGNRQSEAAPRGSRPSPAAPGPAWPCRDRRAATALLPPDASWPKASWSKASWPIRPGAQSGAQPSPSPPTALPYQLQLLVQSVKFTMWLVATPENARGRAPNAETPLSCLSQGSPRRRKSTLSYAQYSSFAGTIAAYCCGGRRHAAATAFARP